ncbi:Cell division control protein 16 [Erysiphe neolycopersici]|uniref:Cell division control protein 16 n=1 Tax=Erysiphe neolycopersici TaxID=212602 RepID=A0A420HAG8_9PEZI|nr:Cell division control protein 16 [Erysiphe neolycopersici]
MSSSPPKDGTVRRLHPSCILDPPSIRDNRSIRRLKSAYSLGQPSKYPALQSHRKCQPSIASVTTPSLSRHARGRSNSDVSNMTPTSSTPRRLTNKKPVAADSFSLDRLIRDGPPNGDISNALESMRLKILDQGIKSDADGMRANKIKSASRIYIWMILINAPVLETDVYLSLIHRGASPAYSKIRNDTFRTLATDPLFRRRVSEASLIRLLNAVAWTLYDAREELNKQPSQEHRYSDPKIEYLSPKKKLRHQGLSLTTKKSSEVGALEPGTYVQGMNVLAAPFLYAARSEAEAFVVFHRFITLECPGYVRGAMDGVHKGLALVDQVLAIVDPKLSHYLIGKGMNAELYAFPSVLTFCACTPPLPEVLRLWDFLFAYGAHLNILCIVAQLIIIRHSILTSPSPTKILRSIPPLQAELVKEITLSIIRKIPDNIYAEIVAHAK